VTGADGLAAERSTHKSRLRKALLLTLGVLAVEVAGGLWAGSLALLADAAHMFTDVAALMLTWAGMALGQRAPTGRHTFGLARAEVLAAFVNAQMLLVASVAILWEAWQRFRSPGPIQTQLMLGIAVIGLVVNVAAARLLHAGAENSLGMRAAYLEVFTDALASLGVLVTALVMSRTKWYGLDAILSAAIAVFIFPRGVGILKEAAHILLEGAPADLDLPGLRSAILSIPGVEEVHDVHFWTLTSGSHSASVHIRASARSSRDEVFSSVQRVLRELGGVNHATIQIEQGSETVCHVAPDHA
jgi:cobalt-zinc-cadmium efflux system protein